METRIVNLYKETYDVYGGRPRGNEKLHYGNPFSHKKDTKAYIVVDSREGSIEAFRKWLWGEAYHTVEPERRKWILDSLGELVGKRIACFCVPKDCHLIVILDLIYEKYGGARVSKFVLKHE